MSSKKFGANMVQSLIFNDGLCYQIQIIFHHKPYWVTIALREYSFMVSRLQLIRQNYNIVCNLQWDTTLSHQRQIEFYSLECMFVYFLPPQRFFTWISNKKKYSRSVSVSRNLHPWIKYI